jgi:hypothetical protein
MWEYFAHRIFRHGYCVGGRPFRYDSRKTDGERSCDSSRDIASSGNGWSDNIRYANPIIRFQQHDSVRPNRIEIGLDSGTPRQYIPRSGLKRRISIIWSTSTSCPLLEAISRPTFKFRQHAQPSPHDASTDQCPQCPAQMLCSRLIDSSA